MRPFCLAIYGVLGLFGIPGAYSQVAGGRSRGKTQYKVLLGGQKRTFYARGVEMANIPVSGGLCFTIQNASWLSETGLPCERGANNGVAGGRSRGKTRYFQRFSPIRVVFTLLWRVPFRGCENIRKYA